MTSECAGAVLEAAEKKRQSLGLKTVGCGPMVESRNKDAEMKLARTREASADAVQAVAREADELDCMESDHEFDPNDNIQQVHDRFQINTRDSHRADKKKKERKTPEENIKQTWCTHGPSHMRVICAPIHVQGPRHDGLHKRGDSQKIILDMLFFLVQLRLSSSYVDFSQCL